MNALFPELLFLGPYFAPLLLRLALSVCLIIFAKEYYKTRKTLSVGSKIRMVLFGAVGLSLLIGFATQLMALLALLLVGDALFFGKNKERSRDRVLLYVLMAFIAVSLFFTGAGALAFDLPY